MPWEDPTLDTDENGIIERILSGMSDSIEDWEPNEGAPEVALAEEIGRQTAATNALAVEALQLALAGIGETVFQLPARTAVAATLPDVQLNLILAPGAAGLGTPATVTQTVSIPAGFTIAAGGDELAFTTPEDHTQTVTFTRITTGPFTGSYSGTLHVEMTATEPGLAGNLPAGSEVTVVTATGLVLSATVIADGVGGVDEEALTDYLDRITDYLATLRPGGVRAADLALLATTVNGVHRAIAADLYDPANPTVETALTATVFAIDESGAPVAGSVATDLQATLEEVREVNFVIHIAAPTYTPISIAVDITAAAGSDPATVQAAVEATLANLIDPATWGNTASDPEAWNEKTSLGIFEVAVAVGQVTGVAAVTGVALNGANTDVALDGPAALPAPLDAETDPSTITVTIA